MTDIKEISYSAYKRYMMCPKQYEYHYRQRLRPVGTSSALIFGSAIDSALNELLGGKTLDVAKTQFYKTMNDANWGNLSIKPGDVDVELMTSDDVDFLLEYATYRGYDGKDVVHLLDLIMNKVKYHGLESITANQLAVVTEASRITMIAKGNIILDKYFTEILPKLGNVQDIQKDIKVAVETGHIVGVLDFTTIIAHELTLKDNKTSARPYDSASVVNDPQLALYCHAMGIDKAGFVVMIKNIDKNKRKICSSCGYDGTGGLHKTCPVITEDGRCHGMWDIQISPEAKIQIITDYVPESNKTLVVEAMESTLKLIQTGIFPRNLNACGRQYGEPCPYIHLCWKQNQNGLEYKKEEK